MIFPLSFFYYEVFFFIFTGKLRLAVLVFLLIPAVFLGSIGYLVTSLFSGQRKKIITMVLLFLAPVPYLTEILIYRQFRVLYDLNTVLSGAGDAVGGFGSDIAALIFHPAGLLTILLYEIPFLVYLILCLTGKAETDTSGRKWTVRTCRIGAGIGAVVSLLVLLLVPAGGRKAAAEYSFERTVSDYGFTAGLLQEISRKITGEEEKIQFSDVSVTDATQPDASETDASETDASETDASGTDASETEVPSGEKVSWKKNEMAIDFQALAKSDTGIDQELDSYVASRTPTSQNEYTGLFKGKNLIFITAEAFSGSVIDPKLTPTLYRLSTKGIQFTDYYQMAGAGTTGGECENLLGILPMAGGSSVKNSRNFNNYFTMGRQLNREGYFGKAYHNNDYKYYSRNETHNNLGYSEGFMGYGNGMEKYVDGSQWPESDLEMMQGTVEEYIHHQPFDIYYMTVSGHSNYSRKVNDMSEKHWSEVADLKASDPVKAYIAANLELEDALSYLVKRLEEEKIADDTVIVLGADHFPYGLDHDGTLGNLPYLSELYGYDVKNNLERDRNRLIIWSGCLEKKPPVVVRDPVQAIDILPTLSNLFGTEFDSRLFAGRDVFSDSEPIVFNTAHDWKTRYATCIAGTGKVISADEKAPVTKEYITSVNQYVTNQLNYCRGLVNHDYFGHLYDLGLLPRDSYQKTDTD